MSTSRHPSFVLSLLAAFLYGLFLHGAGANAHAGVSRLVGPWPRKHHDEQNTGQSQYNGPSTASVRVKPGFPVRLSARAQTSPTIAPDGTIFLGLGFSPLCVFAPTGGAAALLWCTTGGGDAQRSSPTIAFDPALFPPGGPVPPASEETPLNDLIVYLGARDNKLWAVKPTPDGAGHAYTLTWRYKIFQDGDILASPNVDPVNARILASCHCFAGGETPTGQVFALDPLPPSSAGAANWQLVTDAPIGESSPALHPINRRVYAGSSTGELYAFTPDGVLIWKSQKFASQNAHSSPVVGSVESDGSTVTIYLGSADGLHAIRDNGGAAEILWTFPTVGKIESTPALAGRDGAYAGTLYVGDSQGMVYAVKDSISVGGTHTPEEQWRVQLTDVKEKKEKLVRVSPAIGANGKIYLAAKSTVFALNPGSAAELTASGQGRILWKYQVQSTPIRWSSPAIGYYREGDQRKPVVYIGANRKLYAFVE